MISKLSISQCLALAHDCLARAKAGYEWNDAIDRQMTLKENLYSNRSGHFVTFVFQDDDV